MASDRAAATASRTDSALRAWRGFVRAQAALIKGLDAHLLATHNLSLSMFEVLLFLDNAPRRRMRMSELAASVLLTRSGLTRLVDRLEHDHFIVREPYPGDARGWFAVITPAGSRLVRKARKTANAWILTRFETLSDAEIRKFGDLWERLVPGATSET